MVQRVVFLYFGEAKIGELDVTVDVDKDIFRLEVAIEHILVVDVLKAKQDFSEIKLGFLFTEYPLVLQQVKQFAAAAEVDNEVQVILRLKPPVELDYERVIRQPTHHVQLAEHLLVATLFFEDKGFGHRLDRVQRAGVFLSCEIDLFGKSATSNDFDFVEVIHCNYLFLFIFWLFGEHCEKLHPVRQDWQNFLVGDSKPQIQVFIGVFTAESANDFLLELFQFCCLLQQIVSLELELILFVGRRACSRFLHLIRNRLELLRHFELRLGRHTHE